MCDFLISSVSLKHASDSLKIQSEKAAKFIELSAERKELEIGVWLSKINKFTNELREQEHKADAAKASYEICENELNDIETEIEQVLSDIAQINVVIDEIKASSASYEEEALRKDGEASVLETTLNHNNETIERLKNDISIADEGNVSIDVQIEEKQQLIENNDKEKAEKEIEIKALTAEMETLVSSNEEFSQKSIELNQRLTSLTLKLSDCRVKCSQAKSSIDEINSRAGSVDESIAGLDKAIENENSKKSESEKALTALNERIDENNNSLGGYQLKLDGKNKKASDVKDRLEKAGRALAEKQSRAKMLSGP